MLTFRFLILIIVILLPAWAQAATRYAAPTAPALLLGGAVGSNMTGTGTTCSEAAPCTPKTAISQSANNAGDVVIYKNGNATINNPMLYRGDNDVLNQANLSGKHGITIRGQVGGAVLIDGQFARHTLYLANNNNMVIEDLNFRNSSYNLVQIGTTSAPANANILRRIVAWDGFQPQGGGHLQFYGSNDNLLEDFAIFGLSRKIYNAGVNGGSRNTCRRCWMRWEGAISVGPLSLTFMYKNYDHLLENTLVTASGESQPENYNETDDGTNWTTRRTNFAYPGWNGHLAVDRIEAAACSASQPWACGQPANSSTGQCGNNRVMHSISYLLASDLFGLPAPSGSLINPMTKVYRADCYTINHLITVMHPSHPHYNNANMPGLYLQKRYGDVQDQTHSTASRTTTIKGAGQHQISPGWQGTGRIAAASLAAARDAGANPYVGTTGAQTCLRSVNGSLTNQKLWPWPMNERIKAATGYAGNYWTNVNAVYPQASSSTNPCHSSKGNCTGTLGRTRQPTDVTADIESLLGTIPADCRADVTPPPQATPGPLVQYKIDEAASGQAPAALLDSASGTAVNLTLAYGGSPSQPQYTAPGTGRGLEWTAKGSLGGASAAVDGTKVKTDLHGSTKATIAVAADIQDATGGSEIETPWNFALAPVGNTGMSVIVNGVGVTWEGYTHSTAGRHVWQAVVDTTQTAPENRVRLNRDGVDQGQFATGAAPALNATINVGTGRRLSIGNHDLTHVAPSHSLDGVIGGVCYYNVALNASDLSNNATALLANDDAACITPSESQPPTSIVYVGNGAWATSSTSSTLTPGLVTGGDVNDQNLAIIASRTTGTEAVITAPASWTLVNKCHQTGGNNIALQVWHKTGGAPTVAPTFTTNAVGFGWSVALVAWRNTPGPIDSGVSQTGSAINWVPGGVTTLTDNTRVISVVATGDANNLALQSASGFALRLGGSAWDTSRGPHSIGMADLTQGAPGVVAMPTWQQAAAGPDEWCSVTVTLELADFPVPEPPPTGGTPAPIPVFILSGAPTLTAPILTAPIVP